ncbi:MAG: glycosyltransferase family 2 protein [Microcystaceae cyanobacterium]
MKLSIIIPVYNEIHTIDSVIAKVSQVLPHVTKEIVLVDDGSTDGTRQWLKETFRANEKHPVTVQLSSEHILSVNSQALHQIASNGSEVAVYERSPVTVQVVLHQQNQGKGGALRTGFNVAKGDVFVIQDGDLEYDPRDWSEMWRLIEEGWADVVYGSRFYGKPHRVLYFHHLLGNRVISFLVSLLSNLNLDDIEVCYKMFRREVLDGMKLTCKDFGFEVEFTMKMARSRRRWRVYEVGISYYGRTYAEGKKINWKDGVKALWYILKFRLQPTR